MQTYHADVIPFELCEDRGLYLMDTNPKFDPQVCVYDARCMSFIGIRGNDSLGIEKHHNLGGHARPVLFLERFYMLPDINIYTTIQHNLELPNHPTSTTLFNWDLFEYLDEYEIAYQKGVFDLLMD